MGGTRQMSTTQKMEIIEAHKAGEGYKKISMRFQVPRSTVMSVVKKWKLTGTVVTKQRSGRPRKISEKTAPGLAIKASLMTLSASVIQKDLAKRGVVVHHSTVSRYLHKFSKRSMSDPQEDQAEAAEQWGKNCLHGDCDVPTVTKSMSDPQEDQAEAAEQWGKNWLHGDCDVPTVTKSMSDPQEEQAEAAEQWGKNWLHGDFDVPTVTKMLEINIDKVVAGRTGVKFFVPLCGKTVDMKWLAELGHSVVGVERSENAVKQFFVESNMSYTEEFVPKIPGAKVFRNTEKTVSLYQCDIYSFTSSFEGQFDAMWDRGALVVTDPKDREKYAALIVSLMAPGCRYLLGTVLYDPEQYAGPSFLVTDEQVQNLFGSDCDIESLQEEDAEDWADSGLDSISEKMYLLVHKD